MNADDLASKAKTYAGAIDENRWALAGLASEAKRENVPQWAEIISHIVRRAPRTIRQWSQVYEFRDALGTAIDLPISFFSRAMRAVTKLKTEHLVELMDTAAAEGVTLEAFSALLDDLCKPPDEEKEPEDEPMAEPELTPAQQWRAIAAQLELQAVNDFDDGPIPGALTEAAKLLVNAADWWDVEALVDPASLTENDIDWATGEITRHENGQVTAVASSAD